jgi:hypothetical protein
MLNGVGASKPNPPTNAVDLKSTKKEEVHSTT